MTAPMKAMIPVHPWQLHPLEHGHPPEWAHAFGEDDHGPWAEIEVKQARQRFRWMPPGVFWMGSPESEVGRFDGEGPQHEVTLSRGFWIGDTPCTQPLWLAVMGNNPGNFRGKDTSPLNPVEHVSWDNCQQFCAALDALLPGLAPRLPTEAEWEYACRAGTPTATYAGDLKNTDHDPVLDPIAWYRGNAKYTTHPVAQKAPNPWGLYDTLGNVWEWCADGMRRYEKSPALDPRGADPRSSGEAVYRGGAWDLPARHARAASRNRWPRGGRLGFLGFRLARG
jgi:formylglycine-generating enzyme required for sulfatase activity